MALVKPNVAPTRPEQAVMPQGMSPESMLESRYLSGQKFLQQKLQAEWENTEREATRGVYDARKRQTIFGTLHDKARVGATKFNQDYQMQTNNLRELDQLVKSGGITRENADEAKWRIVLGPEAEKGMFPKQEREKTSMQRFSELDKYRIRLDERLRTYNWTAKRGKSKLEIWDPDKGKKGGWTTKGITSDQLEEAMTLTLERNRVKAEQTALLRPGQPSNSIMRTAATSPRMGGAIKDQARALLDEREGQEQQELDDDTATQILQEAGGDKEQARQIARSRGYRL